MDYRTLNKRMIHDQYILPRAGDALSCLSDGSACLISEMAVFRSLQVLLIAQVVERIGDMDLLEVLVYLDDVSIFGRTLEEHE